MLGTPIYQLTSRLQLLEGLRDAVQGHWHLWNNGIKHHNVSLDAILLGSPTGLDSNGSCGVFVDLDLIAPTNSSSSNTALFESALKTGTHAFQSYMVLSADAHECYHAQPHHYLDDLESFFWVLVWIVLGNNIIDQGDNGCIILQPPTLESNLQVFEKDARSAANQKWFYLSVPKVSIPGGWGGEIVNMVKRMRQFFLKRVGARQADRESQIDRYEVLVSQPLQPLSQSLVDSNVKEEAELDFRAVIEMLEEAIEKLKSSSLQVSPF